MVIELEASIHHGQEQRPYDVVRQDMIKQRGITILTFENNQVIQDLEGVLAKIVNVLDTKSKPLSQWERGLG